MKIQPKKMLKINIMKNLNTKMDTWPQKKYEHNN
jgi:hypothetical protein